MLQIFSSLSIFLDRKEAGVGRFSFFMRLPMILMMKNVHTIAWRFPPPLFFVGKLPTPMLIGCITALMQFCLYGLKESSSKRMKAMRIADIR